MTNTKILRRVYLLTLNLPIDAQISSSESWGAYILAPKWRLRCVSMPYIQLIHALLMYLGLLYMLDRPCFFLLAVYSTANAKSLTAIASSFSSEVYIIIFVSLFLDGCPSFLIWIFLQKMKGEGCGKEREGKEILLLFLTKRANNSFNCTGFIIYATYFEVLTCELRTYRRENKDISAIKGENLSAPCFSPPTSDMVYEGARRMPRGAEPG